MPPVPLPPDVTAFLRRPNPAVMASLRGDGAPHTAPTWFLLEPDGSILLNAREGRARLRFIARDARVALSVIDDADFHRHVSVMGRVVRAAPDPGLRDIDRISVHYTGAAHALREGERVSFWMVVESWHGWDPDVGGLWAPPPATAAPVPGATA